MRRAASFGMGSRERSVASSSDERYFVTAGLLNLPDKASAEAFKNDVTDIAGTPDRGTLTGYPSEPDVNGVLYSADPDLEIMEHGHFVLYIVIVHKDGTDLTAEDAGGITNIVTDVLQAYLSSTVITNWSKVRDPGTTTTEPASMAGKTVTKMVMRGRRLLRRTWWKMTSLAATPLALAVRT